MVSRVLRTDISLSSFICSLDSFEFQLWDKFQSFATAPYPDKEASVAINSYGLGRMQGTEEVKLFVFDNQKILSCI